MSDNLTRFKELSAKRVPDPTQQILGDVQAEIRNLEGSLTSVEAAFVAALDRLIDQMPQPAPPVDLSPLLAALEARREPPAALLPPELPEALQPRQDAPLITDDQWSELMQRLVAAVPQSQTTGVGGGSRLRNLAREYVNPATEESVDAVRAVLDSIAIALGAESSVSLTTRMLDSNPASGYTLWFDTGDADHIYTMEALTGTASSASGFRGIRVTLDANGNPVGAVEVNTDPGLTFDARKTDGNWAS